MSTKLSQKEAEALILNKNKEKIILYSSYENDKAFSKFKCLECNNIFTKQFSVVRQGVQCPECKKEINNKRRKEEIKKKTNNEYELISNFTRIADIHKFRHTKCDNIIEEKYEKILKNKACLCKYCNPKIEKQNTLRYSKEEQGKIQEEKEKEIFKITNGKLKLISNFTEKKDYHFFECKCGEKIEYVYKNVDDKTVCKNCRILETADKYIKKHLGYDYKVVSKEYTDLSRKEPILVLHEKCNKVFECKFNSIVHSSYGCKYCKPDCSHGEYCIRNVLEENKILYKVEYHPENCYYKSKLYFDIACFYKDELICLIEYDGEQHFCPRPVKNAYDESVKRFESTAKRDLVKNKYCEDNNIPLLRIKYDQEKLIDTMVLDCINNPQKYLKNHNTFLSNEEYYEKAKKELEKLL